MWSLLNRSSFDRHKRYLKDRFEYDLKNEIPFSLRVDTYFVFEKKRIISKNNKVMKLDADNRLKPLRDAISHVLEIDDKHFFAGECEKVFTDLKDNECAMIRLQYMSPRSLDEVLNLMRTDRERNAQIRSRDS
jgi:Holliday junction resolvase RusA-like endonuclease